MHILMPQLGETVTEGTISKWYRSVGERVSAGDPLFDIETDKTSMEVPAIAAGMLREIRAAAGQTVAAGAVVAVLEDTAAAAPGSDPPDRTHPPAPSAGGPVAGIKPPVNPAASIDPFHGVRTPLRHFGAATLPGGVRITPLARRLAAEAGIDPTLLQGSGPRGRISAADVRSVLQSGAAGRIRATPDPPAAALTALYKDTLHREVPIDSMRRTIARRLTESTQTIPHFYLSAELRVEKLLELRRQINESGRGRVSLNDLLVKAYAMALLQVPEANVVWASDRLLQFQQADIGVAVAIPGGLVTPVLRKVDTKGLLLVAGELAALVARARERKLLPSEYAGGSATVSNLGMFGVRSFQAIINPPQATILAVGAADRRPLEAIDGVVQMGAVLNVSLSVDHRAIDGASAGRLIAALREVVERPLNILL